MSGDRAELLALVEANHQDLVRRINDHFDRQEAARESHEVKLPAYRPKSALYRLAWDTMQAFLSEKGRLPTAVELLGEMDLYDFDHYPLKPGLDVEGKVVRWTDPDDGEKETSLRSFQNALVPMRRALCKGRAAP